jgi:DNA-directed RNA polymerase I, II, and III subunit RPABC2
VERNANGNIVDPYHKTIPFLSKYEYTRILGLRATQIEQGGQVFIETDMIDPYLIAKEELRQKKIPFIIKRPIPGSMEYWKVCDLELLE